ncbi:MULTISPECIES: hybrid sensor histidine kinase/response regulator [unclassified Vibrio]|uniref:ATP-binding response regulator n=1 Tax=unclassified Vibrio TaxID=2614977 RepID=UPI001483C41C|nr:MULTISPECIES: hybrid sensor histidine kinase/response regulator [unclassified Vibrio]NNN45318.1 hybrid sensor histidine kinase/response regulator [Vibrio sp. 1-1(7)]NNN72691.1 hybrid sensor histidine kinase/response regulator [Vibrio sp. 12-2(3-a)]
MDAIKKIYQYAEPNLTLVGWMGLIGFPIYYYVWAYLFPQPYESLALRSFCSLLFAGIAFRHAFPKVLHRYLPYYYLVAIGFCLPFFFFYMMLMNGWSTEWAMSFMASIFLHILLVHETKVMLIQALIASLMAYFSAYYVMNTEPSQPISLTYIPIFIFTYVFGNLFYFRNQVSHESKVSIAKSFGAGIAHEMRNPLSALKSSVDVLRSILPTTQSSTANYTLTAQELEQLHEILTNADEVIHSGNETIDLLLTSIDENRVSTSTFKKHSAKAIVNNAIRSFSYPKALDKSMLKVTIEHEFDFLGSDTLLKFALYNLLKNAFYYQNSEHFQVDIKLKRQDGDNLIVVRDNGIGIAPDQLDEIFKDFYTFGKNNSYGLGLPFCRKVMRSFAGSIDCRSVLGEWTEFILTFPDYFSDQVKQLKLDLMKSKSVLYIGQAEVIYHHLLEQAFYQGFSMHIISLEEAIHREEFEFEFDVILVNLEKLSSQWDKLNILENKFHFTEARIGYLYDKNQSYPVNISRYITVYPIELHHLLLNSPLMFDQLFFEMDNLAEDRNLIKRPDVCYQRRILLVDDNESLRTFSALLLEKQGYDIVQANNGKHALDILSNESVDLIIMDLDMPIMNGFKAAEAIRKLNTDESKIPIIGYTGDDRSETINAIYKNGMNDYIVKPADKDILLKKIANWL